MKRIILAVIALSMALGMTACGSGVSQDQYDKVVSERDALRDRVVELENEAANGITESQEGAPVKSADSSENNDTKDSANAGTRKNPAKIGDTVTIDIDSSMYGVGTLELTMTEIIRGSEAETAVIEANDLFNKAAPEGKEYILARFNIKNIKDKSTDDTPIEVNNAQFSYADSKYTKEDQMNMIVLTDGISAELFEGAETSGTVVFIADEGDACYAIYYDKLWFALS